MAVPAGMFEEVDSRPGRTWRRDLARSNGVLAADLASCTAGHRQQVVKLCIAFGCLCLTVAFQDCSEQGSHWLTTLSCKVELTGYFTLWAQVMRTFQNRLGSAPTLRGFSHIHSVGKPSLTPIDTGPAVVVYSRSCFCTRS